MESPTRLSLGIDTGGTFTDAVVFDQARGVIGKAKALTTRYDLAQGIGESIDAALSAAHVDGRGIGLVSLSTTLATNALVEGQGGRVGLIMIGFEPAELQRDGLAEALGDGPVVFLKGGHNVHGHETPLEIAPLRAAIGQWQDEVDAVAIAGYFAVRNPAHELAVRDVVREATRLPVTCSHEISAALGGPRRALTTVVNARLIALVQRLIHATRAFLASRRIDAPVMIVRGDGALLSAADAMLRPVETILSGPAASLVGARHLTGLADALVADIGGTTTDIAILADGRPALNADGAVVGGIKTMVEAVAMHTYGIGGDSEVRMDREGLKARLVLGPRRLVPLSLAAHIHGTSVLTALRRQAASEVAGRLDGYFGMSLLGEDQSAPSALTRAENGLLARFGRQPVALDEALRSASERAVLERLVQRGYAAVAGFTPSDAMHVLDRQALWNEEAARLGAALMARRKTAAGERLAVSADDVSKLVVAQLEEVSARAILDTAFRAETARGCNNTTGAQTPQIDAFTSPSITRALSGQSGLVRLSVRLDRPVIALGASAGLYYPAICALLAAECVVPEHADVANAVGAVVGQIREEARAVVTSPDGERFVVSGVGATGTFASEEAAMDHARRCAGNAATAWAEAAGAETVTVETSVDVVAPEADGQRTFIEATVVAIATGRPRFARNDVI